MPDQSVSDVEAGAAFTAAAPSWAAADRFFCWLTRWRAGLLTQILDLLLIIGLAVLVFPATRWADNLPPLHYLGVAVLAAAAAHFSFYQGGLYQIENLMNPLRAVASLALRWTMIFVMLAALAALTHEPGRYSRLWFAGFYAAGISSLGLERWCIAWLVRAWIGRGHHTLSVAIVGANALTEALVERFAHNRWGIRIIGVFDDREREGFHAGGVQRLGTVTDLLAYSMTHEVDLVVVTLPLAASERIQAVIRQLRQQPLNVRVLPGAIGLERISPIRLSRSELPGVQLISVADRPISEVALLTKGFFDRAAAALALFLVAPVLLGCAVGIRLSSRGPVLFRQKRIGYKGRVFDVVKFRTMHVPDRPNTELTRRGDVRVFRFGGWLRKLSLDELPQLINVLRGDMSLVGPRPHMPEARAGGTLYFDAVAEYADRQRVKPGITGWAQINGWRGPTETIAQIERRVEHDVYYIDNWSLLLDLVILLKTMFLGFGGKNAF